MPERLVFRTGNALTFHLKIPLNTLDKNFKIY